MKIIRAIVSLQKCLEKDANNPVIYNEKEFIPRRATGGENLCVRTISPVCVSLITNSPSSVDEYTFFPTTIGLVWTVLLDEIEP